MNNSLTCEQCDPNIVYHQIKINQPMNKSIDRFVSLIANKPIGYIHHYDDIYKAVWPTSVVSPNSLLLLIHNTRKVLPEGVKIYNVRGKGYFISKH